MKSAGRRKCHGCPLEHPSIVKKKRGGGKELKGSNDRHVDLLKEQDPRICFAHVVWGFELRRQNGLPCIIWGWTLVDSFPYLGMCGWIVGGTVTQASPKRFCGLTLSVDTRRRWCGIFTLIDLCVCVLKRPVCLLLNVLCQMQTSVAHCINYTQHFDNTTLWNQQQHHTQKKGSDLATLSLPAIHKGESLQTTTQVWLATTAPFPHIIPQPQVIVIAWETAHSLLIPQPQRNWSSFW